MNEMTTKDRAAGCLLGLAVGDAVGTTLEFRARGTFLPIDDMVGGGPFNLKPGQWTDDTSMALCLADSLLACNGFDLRDQMKRYVSWWTEGYRSSTGRCFDIGNATARALRNFRQTGEPQSGDDAPGSAGNGCLMRLAPVPIRYSNDWNKAIALSAVQAAGTHRAVECLQASRGFAELLLRALAGMSKEQILLAPPQMTGPLSEPLQRVLERHSYKAPRSDIRGTGYVVESLRAALWAFWSTENFRDCILAAANLGDDADTTAAIAGQLAGAHYGLSGIPSEWVQRTQLAGEIVDTAYRLVLAQGEEQAT